MKFKFCLVHHFSFILVIQLASLQQHNLFLPQLMDWQPPFHFPQPSQKLQR